MIKYYLLSNNEIYYNIKMQKKIQTKQGLYWQSDKRVQ